MKKILSVVAMIMAVVILSINAFALNLFDMYKDGTYFDHVGLEAASYTSNTPVLYVEFCPTLRLGPNSYGNKEYYISDANTNIGIQMGSVPPGVNTNVAFRVNYYITYRKDTNTRFSHNLNSQVAYYDKIDETVNSSFKLYDSLSGEKWMDLYECSVKGKMYKNSLKGKAVDENNLYESCYMLIDGLTLIDNWENQ